MEGYRIVQAMLNSKAPVHVVVKSFAASMAAVITTLAKHSYAYPNAIILHHEMRTFQFGSMTELKERYEMAKKWEKRLMGPVARKLGMTIEQFRKRMYRNNSNGDWQEFADKAKRLRWVQNVTTAVYETGIVKKPKRRRRGFFFILGGEKKDEKGRSYVNLPRLQPLDMYYIYNPDRYYR
jgi:ATP-dependent Clp protease protease subunit